MNPNTMNIRTKKSLALLLLATLTACESSDLPIQHADSYDYITFSAQTEQRTTRTNPYENYTPEKHPSTMGVFGYYDIDSYNALTATQAVSTPNPIFDNTKLTYNASALSWDYDNPKKWNTYKGAKTFDFFAYMPITEGSKLARTSDNTSAYTLTIPFTIPSETTGSSSSSSSAGASPLFYDVKQAPIICATPVHKQATDADGNELTFERVINLKFDQTLTAYNLKFKLDSKMNAIRQFRITSVTLSGELATSGTISRTYTWNKDGKQEWTTGNIQWTNLTRTKYDETSPFEIINETTDNETKAGDSSSGKSQELVVTSSDYSQWGKTFYVIPDEKFNPTIRVTYDVELVKEDGTTVVTRKGVTSTITLNKTNFDKLTTGGIAMVNTINILIQPRYLYVLADDDAYTGHLLVE